MDDFVLDLYAKANSLDNVGSKALTNFIFRQVIEDVHSKYNIPDEEIKQMCKDAVNRAPVFLEVYGDRRLRRAFLIEAIDCIKWDEPELTDMLKERMDFYKELSKEIN